MKYDFDRVISREGTNSAKYDFGMVMNPNADLDTLPLWVADMDFACAKPIKNAMKARIDKEIFGYSVHATGEYFRAVGSWMQRRFNWYVHSGDIMPSPGVVPALKNLIKCFSEEGDGVIIQNPVYYPFARSISETKRRVVNNSLINNEGYYTIDFEDLEQKAKEANNKVMIFCSPHNPVGRVWKPEELRKVGEICLANDVVLISDEIHFDIVRKNVKHTVLATLFPNDDRIITCVAPSKSFNLAGMHTSYTVIRNEEQRLRWNDVVGRIMYTPLAIWGVQAAYDESEDWMDQVNEYIDANLEYIGAFLKEHLPKVKYTIPEGTYLAWLDMSAYGIKGKELDDLMVKDAKVLLDGGGIFGEEGAYHQRINAACPRSILEECMRRIANTLNKVKKGEALRNFTYESPWDKNNDFALTVNKKTFLIFLRYYGCTMCQLDMINLKERYQEFLDNDSQIFVVLQSEPERIANQVENDVFPYEIICDPSMEIYNQYNLNTAYSMSGMLAQDVLDKSMMAGKIGIKHGEYEGNEFQFPAVILYDENKVAEYVYYGSNPADIPSIDELLSKL